MDEISMTEFLSMLLSWCLFWGSSFLQRGQRARIRKTQQSSIAILPKLRSPFRKSTSFSIFIRLLKENVLEADHLAGKTTIVSSVIENLLDDTCNGNENHNTLVAYFYVKHKQPEKDRHNNVLRALMEQILTRDTVLSDHLFDELASIQGVTLRSNKNLESLIATNLESYQRSFIVIDGLDEAAPGEARKSLNWLLSLVNGGLKEPKVSVRILFSGQRDGNLDHILSEQPSIALESYPEHGKDIQKYCIHMVDQIHQKFGNSITSTMKDEIISRVVGQAKGSTPSS